MRTVSLVPAVPEYYATLDKIAEDLVSVGKDAEKKQKEAKRQLLLYSVPQITAYLNATLPEEEIKYQKSRQRDRLFGYILFIYIVALVCVLCFRLPFLGRYVPPLCLPMHALGLVSNLVKSRSKFNMARWRGLVLLLSEFAGVRQVPFLIDVLHSKESRTAVKRKLSTLLPMYLQSDEPPLNNDRKKQLVRYLKEGFQEVVKQKDESIIETNVSFIAAVLIYFERELAQGRTIPKNAESILARFAASSPNTLVPTSQWTMLKSATEECLAYVGARK